MLTIVQPRIRGDGEKRGLEVQRHPRVIMISQLDGMIMHGESTRPYYLGKAISENGADLLSICRRPPAEKIPHISFVPIVQGKWLLGRFVSVITICARSLLFRPDVIYAHQIGWTAAMGRYLARVLRKPLVFDAHASATEEMQARGNGCANDGLPIEQEERKALASADLIVVVSDELRKFLRTKFAVSDNRMVLIPNGVDAKSFKIKESCEQLARMKGELRIPTDNRVVTFTCPRGWIHNEVALEWFFKVVELVEPVRRDITFLILGDGRIIPPPSSSVLYAGFVQDLPRALAISDVCVLPYPPNTASGGVRNKALEYFAAGKPVVSTSEGMRGIQEAVPVEHYLLANTPEEFGQRILDLLSSESLAREIGSRGISFVESYDWFDLGRKVYATLSIAASARG